MEWHKAAVAGILNNTDALANKIMIMNVYCDNCILKGKVLNDKLIEFMQGDVLEAFRMSTKGDLTIFNLTNAPSSFSYLKKYGDLILFAKNER